MPERFERITVRNYRCLADVSIELRPVNVFFGPNGGGKSALLDALWFVHDCAVRDVEYAAARRGLGYGLRWDGADNGEPVEVTLGTAAGSYALRLGYLAERLETVPGESLWDADGLARLNRSPGDREIEFLSAGLPTETVALREPTRLCLDRYLDRQDAAHEDAPEARVLLGLLRAMQCYDSRSLAVGQLRTRGAEAGTDHGLSRRGENLWSALRNLSSRALVDPRYDVIMRYMRRAFPGFEGLVIEATSPTTVYASFVESGHAPLPATAMSDGQFQMLLMLTALFGNDPQQEQVVLLDEPDLSLHPWALAVLVEAVREATDGWSRQVLLATHSPSLLSQFELDETVLLEREGGATRATRVTSRSDLTDLLDQYALGSLYMAEAIAEQSPLEESR